LSALNLQSSFSKVSVTLISRIIIALVGVIFVPIYVRLIGIESYGLVAFYATLASALMMLDLGLSTAVSRQVAILNTRKDSEKDKNDLIFSVEIIYWSIGLIVGIGIISLANPIANYWVNTKELNVETIEQTVMLMGGVFAFQFPASVYNGVMTGLNKQIPNALINVVFVCTKTIGVIPFLMFIDDSIYAYFIWQVIVVFLMTLTLRYTVWKKFLDSSIKAKFSKEQLRTIWKFAAGMTGISLITFFLTEIDKIVVSKMVLLEFVGYYNLAFLLAGGIQQIVAPIQPVIFPKLAALVANDKQEELKILYHKGSRWIAIIVFPIGFTFLLFSEEILMFWTNNSTLTLNTSPILRVFTIGTICNCLMWMPYYVMLAKGNTRFTIIQNIIAAAILVPMLFILTSRFGIYGASFVWMIVNVGYIIISIPIFHYLFLKGELMTWYFKDIATPLIISGILAVAGKLFQTTYLVDFTFIHFVLILLVCSIMYLFLISELRLITLQLFNVLGWKQR